MEDELIVELNALVERAKLLQSKRTLPALERAIAEIVRLREENAELSDACRTLIGAFSKPDDLMPELAKAMRLADAALVRSAGKEAAR